MKEFYVNYYEEEDDGDIRCQRLDADCDGISVDFLVYNLSETPEDAIIGRDLFDANDYVHALNIGIKIGKAGYDTVAMNYCKKGSKYGE